MAKPVPFTTKRPEDDEPLTLGQPLIGRPPAADVDVDRTAAPPSPGGPPADSEPAKPAKGPARPRRRRAAPAAPAAAPTSSTRASTTRSIQTSVSLPSSLWDALEDVAEPGKSGQLLAILLGTHMPVTATEAALLLDGELHAEGPSEHRNVRLPRPLRAQLDDYVARMRKAKYNPYTEASRSVLIKAILIANMPATPEAARELGAASRAERLAALDDAAPPSTAK